MTSKEIDKILKSPVTQGAKGRFMSIEQLEQIKNKLEESEQKSNPTLLECIKEWNEKGFNVREENNYIYITPKDKMRNEKIMIRLLFKDAHPNAFLTSKQLELLSKTLKALEEMKDE